jgi:hypothetical protein
MPSYPKECKKSLSSLISGPNHGLPDTAYFPYLPVNDLRNDLTDSGEDELPDDLSQIDPSEIAGVHNGHPHGENSVAIDFPSLIICRSTNSYDDELDSNPERPKKVRFRSRVRIASGLNRHRHTQQQGVDYLSSDFSPTSSISTSPSSSISVPLRPHSDEQVGKPGWGTLGQRVSMFAKGNIERRNREQRVQLGLGASSFGVERGGVRGGEALVVPCYTQVDEETPLLSRPRNTNSDSAREIDKTFGTWPGRLTNLYVGFIILSLHSIH